MRSKEIVDRSVRRLKEKQSSASVRTEAIMETPKPAPATRLGSLKRTVTKILRKRRAASFSGVVDEGDDNGKLKPNHGEYQSDGKAKNGLQMEESGSSSSSSSSSKRRNEADLDSLLANVFAGVSAIKAAYAQLQVAESPYDPDTIQASDQAVVSALKHLSILKQSYLKKQQLEGMSPADYSQLLSPQLQEQRNLLKTYQITTRKLESSLQHKDDEIQLLRSQLLDSARFNRSLESKLRPGRTLSLEDLHQSLPDPKHFVSVLRSAVKSVRNFVEQMVREMESAGWDLDAAAGVIQPAVRGKSSEHWTHAFESFVCRCIFSDFQRHDFGISFDGRSSLDRRRFFREFLELSSGKPVEAEGAELGKFIRTKYLSLVHPKMEASFFGNLDQRAAISSGRTLPESEFFALFAEMAKRVWLLHCLYFSYGPEVETAIFEVNRGCRFSEVFMERVAAYPLNFPASMPAGFTVEFTVVPGFRVGKTLIQCKVYVSGEGNRNGRSR